MLKCKKCGKEWEERVARPTPPKHCPHCGSSEVIRTRWPEERPGPR